MIGRLVPGLLLALWACTALAHRGGESQLVLTLAAERVSGDWEISLNDLAPIFQLGKAADDPATAGALVAAHPELADHALGRLHLSADGQPCSIGPATRSMALRPPGPALLLHFEARCAGAPRTLTVAYGLLFDTDPRHQGLLKLQSGELIRPAVFTAESPEQAFTLRNPSVWERATSDLRSGLWHIWTGFDHLMFLLCLLLPSVLVRSGGSGAQPLRSVVTAVLKIVTAFTVAHSITLGLAALHILNLPSRLTESVIAASVVLAAALNIFPARHQRRWQAAFVFGLIHGFGFASALDDMGVSGAGLVATVLAFNLGVEVGQLAVVGVLLPLAYALRKRAWYGPVVIRSGSSVIAVIALLWLVERAFDLKFMPVH